MTSMVTSRATVRQGNRKRNYKVVLPINHQGIVTQLFIKYSHIFFNMVIPTWKRCTTNSSNHWCNFMTISQHDTFFYHQCILTQKLRTIRWNISQRLQGSTIGIKNPSPKINPSTLLSTFFATKYLFLQLVLFLRQFGFTVGGRFQICLDIF